MRTLLVIEPNLRNPSGHYAEFVRALGKSVAGSRIDVFAHPEADEMLRAMQGVAVCSDEPRVGSPAAELRKIYQAVQGDVPFLVLTSDGRHAAAVSLAAAACGRKPEHARLYFHRPPTEFRDSVLLAMSSLAKKHALAIAPTETVARSLRNGGWQRVACVPYPAVAEPYRDEQPPFSHLLMAGAARMNKGLPLIVELAKLWAHEGRSVPLMVQVSKKHATRHGHREAALVDALLASGYRGLQADDKAPAREQYVERFRGALVLAPYDRERFADAVSGIVLDALLHATPVIATAGTWAGVQVDRFGAGLTIDGSSPGALAAAIDKVLMDWSGYAERASVAAQTLAEEHDPRHLLAVLL